MLEFILIEGDAKDDISLSLCPFAIGPGDY
jgi:hypothetical protein